MDDMVSNLSHKVLVGRITHIISTYLEHGHGMFHDTILGNFGGALFAVISSQKPLSSSSSANDSKKQHFVKTGYCCSVCTSTDF